MPVKGSIAERIGKAEWNWPKKKIGPYITAAVGVIPYGTYKSIKGTLDLLKRLPEIEKGIALEPENYTQEALELAGLGIIGGAKGGLPKGETGVGIFYGVRGGLGTGKVAKLPSAKRALDVGKNALEVRQKTGWFKSIYDKEWRFELDDSAMKFKKDIKKVGTMETPDVTLGELIDHEELFKAYPQLKKMPVKFRQIEGQAGSVTNGEIYINPHMSPHLTKKILVHEIQHIVQGFENFAKGGSPAMMEALGAKDPNKAYRYLAGEIEAREAADRQRLSGMLREYIEPFKGTMEEPYIAPSDAIIRR